MEWPFFVISYLYRGTVFRRGEIRWFRGLFTLYGELAFALIASLWHDAEGVVLLLIIMCAMKHRIDSGCKVTEFFYNKVLKFREKPVKNLRL